MVCILFVLRCITISIFIMPNTLFFTKTNMDVTKYMLYL